jgi:hypothetical protein
MEALIHLALETSEALETIRIRAAVLGLALDRDVRPLVRPADLFLREESLEDELRRRGSGGGVAPLRNEPARVSE